MATISLAPVLAVTIPWSRVTTQFVMFLAYFAIFGALGFRFVVVRPVRPDADRADPLTGLAVVYDLSVRTAALCGWLGALLLVLDFLLGNLRNAKVGLAFGVALLVLFAAALGRIRPAWPLAAVTAVAFAFQGVVTSGKWTAIINPLHMVAASLWLGTLFVFVVAGLGAILAGKLAREQRGPLVAGLVARFSNLALVSAGVLFATGFVTAWLHLKFLAALWTTAYGEALLVKLGIVALVAALGAWNWRRVTPTLGTESSTYVLRRSSTAELTFGAAVLVVTAVLVSLPSPKLPQSSAAAGAREGSSPTGGEKPKAAPSTPRHE